MDLEERATRWDIKLQKKNETKIYLHLQHIGDPTHRCSLVCSTQRQRRGAEIPVSCLLRCSGSSAAVQRRHGEAEGRWEAWAWRGEEARTEGGRRGDWNRYMPIVYGDRFRVCRPGGAGWHCWVSGQRRMKWEESSGIWAVAECRERERRRNKICQIQMRIIASELINISLA